MNFLITLKITVDLFTVLSIWLDWQHLAPLGSPQSCIIQHDFVKILSAWWLKWRRQWSIWRDEGHHLIRHESLGTCTNDSVTNYPREITGIFRLYLKHNRGWLCCSHAEVFPAYTIKWPCNWYGYPFWFCYHLPRSSCTSQSGKDHQIPKVCLIIVLVLARESTVSDAGYEGAYGDWQRDSCWYAGWMRHLCIISLVLSAEYLCCQLSHCSLGTGGHCGSFTSHQRSLQQEE